MAMKASQGEQRFAAALASLRTAVQAGPQWQTSRLWTTGAAALVAALAVTGVVALGSTGTPAASARDAAATTTPAKPHYLLPIAALIQDGSVPPPSLSGDNGTIGVPKGTAARPTKPAAKPVAGSSGITTYRGATGTMTPAGIATLALQRGCSAAQAPIATAVAMAESGGSPSAQGDVRLMTPVWDWSAGLWQIRGLRSERGSGGLRDSIANQRATTNAAAMYVISSGCSNWSPWTTYTRGLYLGYLGVARQAVSFVLAYRSAHGRYPSVAAPDPNAVVPVSTGGGAAQPASAQSGTPVAGASRGATATKTAPKTPGPARSTTGAGQQSGGGTGGGGTGGKASGTPAKSSPTKTPTSKPVIVSVPPVSLPVLPPITIPPITLPALPTCLILCKK